MSTPATWLAFAITGLAMTPTQAADAKVDAELLEFLGAFGDDSIEELVEYIEQRAKAPATGKPAASTPPSNTPQGKKP